MNGSYDPILVTLSVLIAIFASYTALDLANSVTVTRGRARTIWVSAGALAMGVGIWSMHFVGMLAFTMPGMRIAYDIALVILSILVAILASALALFIVSRATVALSEMLYAGLAMGVAIAGMHYIGMWSMRLPAAIEWSPALVGTSILIAVAASFVALWLAYRYRIDPSGRAKWIRIGGGVVMGFAIAGMHYTAMAAARFLPLPVDLVRVMADKHAVTLHVHDALASEQFISADRQRLKQILLNLLSNAIKYNRSHGTVTLSCEPVPQDRLRIVVRDTGHGIAAGKLERLCTPFDRLGADQTAVEGTGLGLALSKGLIEAMGGRLGVESVEGGGSTFWVELPLASSAGAAPSVSQVRHPRIQSEPGERTHTVLLVEDNLANVRLMERLFQRRPRIKLITAMQGRLGVELAREHRPDLILLDVNLPDISGDRILIQLQQDASLSAVPVIMISGDAIPSQIQRMLELGAQAYVTKPFNIHEFLRVLDEHLDGPG